VTQRTALRFAAMKHTRMDSATATPNRGRAPTPNEPIASTTLAFDRWQEGARFGGGEIPLADLGGATRIGVNLVELTPGRQSCPAHWHLREEDTFYVCFPAGTRVAHSFENPYDAPCTVLAIGNRDADEIAVYPDSGKAKLRALDRIVPWPPAPDGDGLDYWQGEATSVPLVPAQSPEAIAAARKAEVEAAKAAADRAEAAREREVDDALAAMKKRLGI
jgi:uncharacterized cupin superfamily protein